MFNVIRQLWCQWFPPAQDRWQDQSDHIKRDSWQDW